MSSLGKIKSLKANKEAVLKVQYNAKGYPQVRLYKNGNGKTIKVHRLVANAFIPNPLKLPQVNHKDTNKENNAVENLEWITNADNMRHAFENGCFKTTRKQIEHALKNQSMMAKKRRKKVIMCDLAGKELKIYDSLTAAERETGISNSKIACVCKKKRKTAGGYTWKYKEEGEK